MIRVLDRHRLKLDLSCPVPKVSSTFCRLNEGRLRRVVGMQRLREPLIWAFVN